MIECRVFIRSLRFVCISWCDTVIDCSSLMAVKCALKTISLFKQCTNSLNWSSPRKYFTQTCLWERKDIAQTFLFRKFSDLFRTFAYKFHFAVSNTSRFFWLDWIHVKFCLSLLKYLFKPHNRTRLRNYGWRITRRYQHFHLFNARLELDSSFLFHLISSYGNFNRSRPSNGKQKLTSVELFLFSVNFLSTVYANASSHWISKDLIMLHTEFFSYVSKKRMHIYSRPNKKNNLRK